MSGALAAIGAASSGGLAGAVLGLLRQASWRGVPFDVLDSRHALGRRWVRTLFPGRRDTVHEDLGAVDGAFELQALIVGDDCVRRVRRMEAACTATGPGTLRHPWLGPMKVVLAQPARFQFEDKAQRLCTVTLVFEPWQEPDAPTPGLLGRLLNAVDAVLDAAREFLADVLSPLGDALGLLSLAQSVMARVGGAWTAVLGEPSSYGVAMAGTSDASALARAAAGPLDRLTGGVALDPSQPLAPQISGLLADVCAAVADAADRGADPAIGPGPLDARPTAAADPRAAAAALLALIPLLRPGTGDLPVVQAILHVARVQALGEAVRAASAATWESRDEAVAWRDRVALAHDALTRDLTAAGPAAAPVWRSVHAQSLSWSTDMSERTGRLAAVRHVVVLAPVSAWAVALAVAGDTPAAIRPTYLDLIARNRLRHPAIAGPGRLEVLLR